MVNPMPKLLMFGLGGVRGVLRRMKLHNCQPDVKTFHHLLCALPWKVEYETAILKIMQVVMHRVHAQSVELNC